MSGRRPRRASASVMTDPLAPAPPRQPADPPGLARRRPALGWGLAAPAGRPPHRQHRPGGADPRQPGPDSPTPYRPRARRRSTRLRTASGLRLVMALPFRSTPLPGHPGHDHASSEIGKPAPVDPDPGCCGSYGLCTASRSAWPEGPAGRPAPSGPTGSLPARPCPGPPGSSRSRRRGDGSYSIHNWTIRAVGSSVSRATSAKARSIPADTRPVMTLPSSTHRSGVAAASSRRWWTSGWWRCGLEQPGRGQDHGPGADDPASSEVPATRRR